MTAYKRIRALSRAVTVLEHLNGARESSSNAVARAIGLPKTTSYRMLHSLIDCGLVYFSPSQCGFRLTPNVEKLSPGTIAEPCAEAIEAALHDLSLKILWPCAFSVPTDAGMIVRARTHRASPFAIPTDLHLRRGLGTSAAGLAFLAFADPADRDAALGQIGECEDAASLLEELERIRLAGFVIGPDPQHSELAALAVPLRDGPRAIGSLHVTWLRSERDCEAVILERVLPLLQATRGQIEDAVGDLALA